MRDGRQSAVARRRPHLSAGHIGCVLAGYRTVEESEETMTDRPDDHGRDGADDAGADDGAGVEITTTDGDGTTFEPEEDPEGRTD